MKKNEIVTIQIRYSKSIVDEKDILKYFMRFDIIPCDSGGARISIQRGQD